MWWRETSGILGALGSATGVVLYLAYWMNSWLYNPEIAIAPRSRFNSRSICTTNDRVDIMFGIKRFAVVIDWLFVGVDPSWGVTTGMDDTTARKVLFAVDPNNSSNYTQPTEWVHGLASPALGNFGGFPPFGFFAKDVGLIEASKKHQHWLGARFILRLPPDVEMVNITLAYRATVADWARPAFVGMYAPYTRTKSWKIQVTRGK